ncbi:MAG: outer membrane protein assembly factor BamA [Rickettsiaceae bacterium]
MSKFLRFILIVVYLNNIAFAADLIKQISVEGNQRIESSTIENYSEFKVGEEYTEAKKIEAIKNLYTLSIFEDIKITFNKGELLIDVKENPFVSGIEFKGNGKIKQNILNNAILSQPGESLSNAKIASDIEKIKSIYKRSGRFATKVNVSLDPQPNDRVKVIFNIEEGPKTTVKYIYFVGNEHYSNSKLRSIIVTKEYKWFKFLDTNDVYDPDRIEYDKDLLKDFYQSVGFADFHVISVSAELSKTKEYFTVTYSLDEGQRYTIGSINVDNKINDANFAKLITVKQGSRFNMSELEKIAQNISTELANNGYPQVSVYPSFDLDHQAQLANITFIIEKAQRIYLSEINISGNVKTRDKVIRREFRINEGDLFDRNYIVQGLRSVNNLNFFSNVGTSLQPTESYDKYNLDIKVEEKSTTSFDGSIGYDTIRGPFMRLGFNEENLLGSGKSAGISTQIGKRNHGYSLDFHDPYLFDRNLSLSNSIFNQYSGRGSGFDTGDQNYSLRTIGDKVTIGSDITEDLLHELDYTIKRTKMTPRSGKLSLAIEEQRGSRITSAIGQSLIYDKTDNKIAPKHGYIIIGSQEVAGVGGDSKYFKNELEARIYHSFIEDSFTFSLSGSAGHIIGFGDKKQVPINERFNLMLRGFDFSGVGPRMRNTKEFLGGQEYYKLVSELSFPTGLPKEIEARGFIFADMGALYGVKLSKNASYNKSQIYDPHSPRASVGFGVLIVTRMSPIRLTWGYPIKKKYYDEKKTFNITFSTQF